MSNNKYEINIKDFQIMKTIGSGAYAKILMVKNIKTDEVLVAKVYFKKPDELEDIAKFITRDVTILMRNQHPTIVHFQGFSYTDFDNISNLTIFMDYMPGESLRVLLNKANNALAPMEYNDTKKQIILAGIAKGMMELHLKNVFHRDLKPENILLDNELKPRITDFGLSKSLDPNDMQNQSEAGYGTLIYMAPEVMISKKYSLEADVYSFGILMYEVVTSKYPYENLIKNKEINYKIQLPGMVIEGFRPEFTDPSIKKSLEELIKQCWSPEASNRPTFQQIYDKLSSPDMQYCFDGVDPDEFNAYIDEINDYNDEVNADVAKLQKKNALIEKSYQIELKYHKLCHDDLKKKYENEIQMIQSRKNMANPDHKIEKPIIYNSIKGKIIKANALHSFDLTKPNTRVVISVIDQNNQIREITQSEIQYNTHDPVWNFDFQVLNVSDDEFLRIDVIQISKTMGNQCIASISFTVEQLKEKENLDEELKLDKPPNISDFAPKNPKFGTIVLNLSCSTTSNNN